jgi:hypothetical protein
MDCVERSMLRTSFDKENETNRYIKAEKKSSPDRKVRVASPTNSRSIPLQEHRSNLHSQHRREYHAGRNTSHEDTSSLQDDFQLGRGGYALGGGVSPYDRQLSYENRFCGRGYDPIMAEFEATELAERHVENIRLRYRSLFLQLSSRASRYGNPRPY